MNAAYLGALRMTTNRSVSRHRLKAWSVVAFQATLDFLLPRTCVCCDAALSQSDHRVLCTLCIGRLARLPAPQCPRCGHPRSPGACRWCEMLPPFVRAVRSVCWVPGGPAGEIVHKLKYSGWTALAEPMAEQMARLNFPVDVTEERDLLVPVPLARARARERGYNQSELLARLLGARWGVPVQEALVRRRATETQTRLTPGDRLRNVAGAFATVLEGRELAGRHVVLVDDVVTTAATLNACAKALHTGGARIISYVTFGRARAAGDTP
jgi:ComF family protein